MSKSKIISKSKNDIGWEKLFAKHKIIENVLAKGYTIITSAEINAERQARLMTKIDHKSQLPQLFVENKFSILPISRGSYVIGAFDTFCEFNTDDTEITKIDFPTFLESLNYKDISSEATAIHAIFVSKILHDFTGESNLFPTVSGRMSSSTFGFSIDSKNGLFKVKVENSQLEIDGGYEGDNSLNLIEAKNYISDDFLIRQLYYPFKLWNNKITKKVRPIFLTYTNGIFHLREYGFENVEHYNSLKLIKQKKYAVRDAAINIEIIQQILESVKIENEPEIPFPQANSFERVINLCELLDQRGFIPKEEITTNYDFDSRQTDYYSNAGRYLGLVETGKDESQIGCFLTKNGQRLFNLSITERQIEFIKLILSYSAFNKTLKLYFEQSEIPSKEQIVEIMKGSNLYRVRADDTFERRSSTISGWINWILNQIEE
jgi:hypothetical protein